MPSRIAGVSPFFFSMKLCCTLKISIRDSSEALRLAKLRAFRVKHEKRSRSLLQRPSICVMLIWSLGMLPKIILLMMPTIFCPFLIFLRMA